MIMPEYLFEFNGFNLIKKSYSINDILGFGNSACDVTGSLPIPPTKQGLKEGLSYYWFCLSLRNKNHNKTYFSVILTCHRVP